MNASQRRIARLGLLLVFAAAGVAIHLFQVMVEENERWVGLSHRNRWAFRDVPTRRGSILDRDGRVLVQDVPAFRLEAQFRALRRTHPIVAAVHAVALLDGVTPRFERRTEAQALDRLLGADVATMAVGDHARDLRYYLRAVVAALAPLEVRRALTLRLRDLDASSRGVVADLFDPSTVVSLRTEYAARVSEYARIGEWIDGPAGSGLTGVLQQLVDAQVAVDARTNDDDERERARAVIETRWRTLCAEIPFADAAWLTANRERHPGLFVRHEVVRAQDAESLAAAPSLASVLGVATPIWQTDFRDDPDTGAPRIPFVEAAVAPAVERIFEADELGEDVPEIARTVVERELRQRMLATHRRGRGGVEAAADAELSGMPGLRWVERDRRTQELFLWQHLQVAPGRDVSLTIDFRMQRLCERVVEFHAASQANLAIVVVDPQSGDVLTLAGRPLDGPVVVDGVRTDERRPLSHPPGMSWPNAGDLGSVVKPFVLLEHLDGIRNGRPSVAAGGIRPCHGTFPLMSRAGRPLTCDASHGERSADPVAALAESCNVHFYELSLVLKDEGLRRAFARAGWQRDDLAVAAGWWTGDVDGIGAPGTAGIYELRQLQATRAIGYGIAANVLQVARAYAGLATGSLPTLGFWIRPEGRDRASLQLHDADLGIAREGLRACVTIGTARRVGFDPRWQVHGKTGTAEVRAATAERGDLNNAWFAGYCGVRPTIAFAAVVYDVSGHGADEAGALVRDLLRAIDDDDALRTKYLPSGRDR